MSVKSPQSPAYRPLPALSPTSPVSFSPRNIPTPVNLYPTLILRRAPRDNTAYGLSEPSQESVVPVTVRPGCVRHTGVISWALDETLAKIGGGLVFG
ncbi:hypothetical protein L915_05078 [Phytophthora nicotianae]|uniref:Uncharacterized protein n=1 Tax=Phytophthora nicotianae TaxID=4792 RepID=W2H7T9_PHYNI|nr:hypothetical protein L915_05078 [Phytophthora nicotianae]